MNGSQTRALGRMKRRFDNEVSRQIDLVMASAMVALHRRYGWGKKRISDTLDMIQEAWFDSADHRDASMLMQLEAETGIELRAADDGKSYHDIAYLNGTMKVPIRSLPFAQQYYIGQQQIKWMESQILASVFLTIHRKCGFGADRLTTLLSDIREVQEECSTDPIAIRDTLQEETGVVFRQ